MWLSSRPRLVIYSLCTALVIVNEASSEHSHHLHIVCGCVQATMAELSFQTVWPSGQKRVNTAGLTVSFERSAYHGGP